MRTGDLLFIVLILAVGCFGGIVLIASQQDPTNTTDTFGTATSAQTNETANMTKTFQSEETNYSGLLLVFAAGGFMVMLIIGFMLALKKGGLGRGKYRTG